MRWGKFCVGLRDLDGLLTVWLRCLMLGLGGWLEACYPSYAYYMMCLG